MLKLDPKNTELLAQKQNVLRQNIESTSNKLKELKNTQDLFIKSGGDLNSAEYRNLQREIIKTESDLRSLNLENSKWIQASKSLGELSSKLSTIGSTVESVGRKVSVLSGAIAGLFAVGIKYNANIETTTKAFETFIGNAEDAKKAIKAIKNEAKQSPFDTKDLIKANQYLVTTGENADRARKVISALADAIALTGGGNDELNRMASNLQQIRNAGKATAMDIRQFAYAGIDVYGILAETTGKNVEELKKMDITYQDLTQALLVASSEGGKYYNGQITMADTLNGKISKLKKTFEELVGELSETLMPVVDKITDKLQEWTDKFSELDPAQKEMIVKIGLAVVALGPLLIILGKLISSIGFIVGGISQLSAYIGTATAGIGGLGTAVSGILAPLGLAVAVIGSLVVGFIALWNRSEDFRNSMTELGQKFTDTYNEYIKPTVDNIKDILSKLWNDIIIPLSDFWTDTFGPVFQVVCETIGSVFAEVFGIIGTILKSITGAFSGLIDFISGVFTGNWEKAWEGIKSIFGNIFGGLVDLAKRPLNMIISSLNSFINEINKIKIPDWIPRNRRKTNKYS